MVAATSEARAAQPQPKHGDGRCPHPGGASAAPLLHRRQPRWPDLPQPRASPKCSSSRVDSKDSVRRRPIRPDPPIGARRRLDPPPGARLQQLPNVAGEGNASERLAIHDVEASSTAGRRRGDFTPCLNIDEPILYTSCWRPIFTSSMCKSHIHDHLHELLEML